MSTAVIVSPGMPSVIIGISAPPTQALLEASGPVMPSGTPVPNSVLRGERRCSCA